MKVMIFSAVNKKIFWCFCTDNPGTTIQNVYPQWVQSTKHYCGKVFLRLGDLWKTLKVKWKLHNETAWWTVPNCELIPAVFHHWHTFHGQLNAQIIYFPNCLIHILGPVNKSIVKFKAANIFQQCN